MTKEDLSTTRKTLLQRDKEINNLQDDVRKQNDNYTKLHQEFLQILQSQTKGSSDEMSNMRKDFKDMTLAMHQQMLDMNKK